MHKRFSDILLGINFHPLRRIQNRVTNRYILPKKAAFIKENIKDIFQLSNIVKICRVSIKVPSKLLYLSRFRNNINVRNLYFAGNEIHFRVIKESIKDFFHLSNINLHIKLVTQLLIVKFNNNCCLRNIRRD